MSEIACQTLPNGCKKDNGTIMEVVNFSIKPFSDSNNYIKSLFSTIVDKKTPRQQLVFSVDCIVTSMMEEALNMLPFTSCQISTPTNSLYSGLKFHKEMCCVTVIPNGEMMERGVRACETLMEIGRIMIKKDSDGEYNVTYPRLPNSISTCFVFVLIPFLDDINHVKKLMEILGHNGVVTEKIIVVSLFASQKCLDKLLDISKNLKMVIGEIGEVIPREIVYKYFNYKNE